MDSAAGGEVALPFSFEDEAANEFRLRCQVALHYTFFGDPYSRSTGWPA